MKKPHLLGSMLALSEVLSGGYSPFTQRRRQATPGWDVWGNEAASTIELGEATANA